MSEPPIEALDRKVVRPVIHHLSPRASIPMRAPDTRGVGRRVFDVIARVGTGIVPATLFVGLALGASNVHPAPVPLAIVAVTTGIGSTMTWVQR